MHFFTILERHYFRRCSKQIIYKTLHSVASGSDLTVIENMQVLEHLIESPCPLGKNAKGPVKGPLIFLAVRRVLGERCPAAYKAVFLILSEIDRELAVHEPYLKKRADSFLDFPASCCNISRVSAQAKARRERDRVPHPYRPGRRLGSSVEPTIAW